VSQQHVVKDTAGTKDVVDVLCFFQIEGGSQDAKAHLQGAKGALHILAYTLQSLGPQRRLIVRAGPFEGRDEALPVVVTVVHNGIDASVYLHSTGGCVEGEGLLRMEVTTA